MVLISEPEMFCLNHKDKFMSESHKIVPKNMKEMVLEGKWIAWSTRTTEDLKETY